MLVLINLKTFIMTINLPTHKLKKIFFSMAFLFVSVISFAQDSTVKATTTTNTTASSTETMWYMNPIAWVVGGIVLLVLLIALFRNNSSSTSSDRVTVTKTVSRDSDV
jgi:hypothetical protein